MVAMPEKPSYTAEQKMVLLSSWYNDKQQLAELKKREILRRKDLVPLYFADPKEGTNTTPLGDGYELVFVNNFNRDVDDPALDALTSKLRKAKIKVDELFKYEPKLIMSEYRKLTEEQRALVDECLVIKEGSPSLDIRKQSEQPAESPAPAAAPSPNAIVVATHIPGPLMEGLSVQDFYAQGWTDQQMIDHGYLIPQLPEGPDPTVAPAKKGRGRPKKNGGK